MAKTKIIKRKRIKRKPPPKAKTKRASLKSWVNRKFLEPAKKEIQVLKFRNDPSREESHEEGRERTYQIEKAQARFDAYREIHDSL